MDWTLFWAIIVQVIVSALVLTVVMLLMGLAVGGYRAAVREPKKVGNADNVDLDRAEPRG